MVEMLDNDGWGEENQAAENNVEITVNPNTDVDPE